MLTNSTTLKQKTEFLFKQISWVTKKQATPMAGNDSRGKPDEHVEILDVSEYKPRRIPSKQWRECIKKIYEEEKGSRLKSYIIG